VPDLLVAEVRRHWINYRRYPTEVASGVIMMALTFMGLLAGGAYMAGSTGFLGSGRVDSFIVGYWIWMLVVFVIADGAGTIQRETLTGTLEQLYMSPKGALKIILTRIGAALGFHIVITSTVLSLLLLITGVQLHFQLAALLPLAAIIGAALGLSLTFGALTLVFKRVDQMTNLLRFFLFIPVMMPPEAISEAAQPYLYSLPMMPGVALLRSVLVPAHPGSAGLTQTALLNGLVYLAVGIAAFRIAERTVRRRGGIGHH
jgi:ABC-2 type transport system permease protein